MLLTKLLMINYVNEVNALGQFIKLVSCENKVRLKATKGGETVIETEIKAGFELQTAQLFDKIELVSEHEQKIELWVSKHALKYDAMSTKPSRSQSFIANHYGLSQQLLAYDSAQASVKLSCDTSAFWVGGEGVNDENGLLIAEKELYAHDSAAPLHVYIRARPDKTLDINTASKVESQINSGAISGKIRGDYLLHDGGDSNTYYTQLSTGISIKLSEPMSSINSYESGFVGLRGWDTRSIAFVKNGEFSTVYNPNSDGFTASCCTVQNDVAYILGAKNTAQGAENKVCTYSLKNEVWSTKQLPTELANSNISSAFADEYNNYIWFIVDDKLWRTTDAFASAEKYSEEAFSGRILGMSFSEGEVMIITENSGGVFARDTKQFVNIKVAFPALQSAVLIGRHWLIFSKDKIYTTDDKLSSYNLAYKNDSDFVHGAIQLTFSTATDSDLFFWTKSSNKSSITRVTLAPDLSAPKAKFRVMKELY